MNIEVENEFENALTSLQHVLIARRVMASDEQMRLNWNHFNIMVLAKERGSVLPSQISDELRLSRPTTSKYLKYLKANGLISTSISKNDRRSYTIHLTSLSKQILQNIIKGQQDNAKLALHALTTTEAKQFAQITAKITAALDNESLRTI